MTIWDHLLIWIIAIALGTLVFFATIRALSPPPPPKKNNRKAAIDAANRVLRDG